MEKYFYEVLDLNLQKIKEAEKFVFGIISQIIYEAKKEFRKNPCVKIINIPTPTSTT